MPVINCFATQQELPKTLAECQKELTHFYKAKAHAHKTFHTFAILIKACC